MSKQSNVTAWTCDYTVGCDHTEVTQGDLPIGWMHVHWRIPGESEMRQLYYCSYTCSRNHLGILDLERTPRPARCWDQPA